MVKTNPQGPFYRPLYNLGSPVDLVWLLGLPDAHCMGAGQVDLVNIYRLTFDPKKKKKTSVSCPVPRTKPENFSEPTVAAQPF